MGILRHNNPEQYRIIFKKTSLDVLISEIEKKINIELKFKNVFPGEKGVKTQKGIISSKKTSTYQASNKNIKKYYKRILKWRQLGRHFYCYRFGLKISRLQIC